MWENAPRAPFGRASLQWSVSLYHTVLRSASGKRIALGRDRPFVMIGERINPTNKKRLTATLAAGDFSYAQLEARRQFEAGAKIIDVNVGLAGLEHQQEADLLKRAVVAIAEAVPDAAICIDSSTTLALEEATPVCPGRPLVNSTTAEPDQLERIMRVVKRCDTAVIGLAQDAARIPPTVEGRMEAVHRILEGADRHGVSREDVVIDPCTMPIGADSTWEEPPEAGNSSAMVTLQTAYRVSRELGNNISTGGSNISFAMPDRMRINSAFLIMLMFCGATTSHVDPLKSQIIEAVRVGDMLTGRDEFCGRYIAFQRQMAKAAKAVAEAAGGGAA